MAAAVGTGTTFTFSGTGSFTGQVLSITLDGEEVPVIDVSHFGTTGYREKIAGDLVEPPQATVQINFEPSNPPPLGGSATGTITFPDSSTFSGSGFFMSRSAEVPLEDKITGTFVFQFDGVTGPAFA